MKETIEIRRPYKEMEAHTQKTIDAKPAHRWLTGSIAKVLLYGGVSAAAYFLIFSNEKSVTQHFTRGGIYTLAIIGTALAVSIVYGAFASSVLEIIGLKPSVKGNKH